MNYEAALLNVSLLWLLTTPHEFAHAWTALKLGDDTPKNEGRVTLNPLAHVDWIGTVLLPALTSLAGMGFLGWGRAVNTNPYRLRGGLNGLAAVALAGPASNVVLAFILAAAAALTASWLPAVAEYLARGVRLSLYLALFSRIPVPPLDGSKLLLALRFPMFLYNELSRFGFLVLVALLAGTGLLGRMWLWSYAGASRILGWML
jgi:Zn-dependent protease